jgi:truncated hemoglobin YjbI
VRAVVDRFVDRQFDDFIIGFLFAGKDRDRVKRHEYEHAAGVLGAPIAYTGRPIAPLHRALRINAGQFRRRLALLRQEIDRAGIPEEIRELWLDGQRAMERVITDGTDCTPP